jgi:hypothetical protein
MAMIFVLVYSNFKSGTEFNILNFMIYILLITYGISSVIRRYAIYHFNQKTKNKIIKITRFLNLLLPIYFLVFTISISSNYFTARQVQAAVHPDFVSSSELSKDYFTWGSPVERSTQSQFSLTPTATYLFFCEQEDLYHIFVYQTRTFHFTEMSSDDLIITYYTKTAIAPDIFATLELELKEQNYVRFKNPYSDQDYLSIEYKNHVIYTLHTVNISLEEHQNLLNQMGRQT